MAALLVDLSKVFERVNPYWILHILRMRNAPTWVCNYAKYILFGRLIRHKVQGRLLPPRAFFRPTPCGFRQVVQQLSKPVANEINY